MLDLLSKAECRVWGLRFTCLLLAGNEGMEARMETADMRTTMGINSFFPCEPAGGHDCNT